VSSAAFCHRSSGEAGKAAGFQFGVKRAVGATRDLGMLGDAMPSEHRTSSFTSRFAPKKLPIPHTMVAQFSIGRPGDCQRQGPQASDCCSLFPAEAWLTRGGEEPNWQFASPAVRRGDSRLRRRVTLAGGLGHCDGAAAPALPPQRRSPASSSRSVRWQ